MKIISISDIITNSSSEVFIIHSKPEFQDEINQEIPELLTQLCELVGLDLNETMEFEVSDKSGVDEDWEYYKAKNDLIIWSAGDNTIPSWLMYFIEDINYIPQFKDKFSGYYAKDLGEKEIPYYDWNAPEGQRDTTRLVEIQSIQRIHLG